MNAPQRHHRHREEPKARPLRVGDTEKPGPEGERLNPNTLFLTEKQFNAGLQITVRISSRTLKLMSI